MPITAAYTASCRTSVLALAELTTFRAAKLVSDLSTRDQRKAAWTAANESTLTGPSPAYNLRRAIREVVNSQGDITGNITGLDRETAYQSLVSEFVPDVDRPASAATELAAQKTILGLT